MSESLSILKVTYLGYRVFSKVVRWSTTNGGINDQLVAGSNVMVEISMLIFGKVPRRADR